MKLVIGMNISFLYKNQELEGMLLTQEKDLSVIKLNSGYNITVKNSEIKNVKERKVPSKNAPLKSAISPNTKLPKISILHTGGTIASKVDYRTGGVISRYTAEEILGLFPELQSIANVSSRLIRNMWSEDLRFSHYNLMAEEIKKEIDAGATGVIVTHGTDTMHYTGAALSFILNNLPVPVVLVGAQRSSDRGSGDAALNLLAAAHYITQQQPGVSLCMHESINDDWCVILPGTRSRKMHSSRRDAFKPVNDTPLARINPGTAQIELLQKTTASGHFELLLFKPAIKVALVKIHPNFTAAQIEAMKSYKGLVLEGYGIGGNLPINEIDKETKENAEIKQAISALIKSGTIIAAASQTIYGRLNQDVYTTGRDMQEMGILGHLLDMTPETAFLKLSWLLSNYDKSDIKKLYQKNLRGEISERSKENEFEL